MLYRRSVILRRGALAVTPKAPIFRGLPHSKGSRLIREAALARQCDGGILGVIQPPNRRAFSRYICRKSSKDSEMPTPTVLVD
jgi:hypothetical protein